MSPKHTSFTPIILLVYKYSLLLHCGNTHSCLHNPRLDRCNTVLYGILTDDLQNINAKICLELSCLVAHLLQLQTTHHTYVPHLHWLSIKRQIHFKVILITNKALNKIGTSDVIWQKCSIPFYKNLHHLNLQRANLFQSTNSKTLAMLILPNESSMAETLVFFCTSTTTQKRKLPVERKKKSTQWTNSLSVISKWICGGTKH